MEPAEAWRLTDGLMAEHGKGDPFAAAIRATRMAMIITDPRQVDNPIVFVNDAFLDLTGYARDEVMGRNCRFLQGKDTDRGAVNLVREAIEARRDIGMDLLNYRKDGTPFWNALYVSPVINQAGELLYFFASQLDITDRVDAQAHTLREKERFERQVVERTRELTEALATKTMLVHEVDHRAKNNLQMISSLLWLRTRNIADPDARAAMEQMIHRVEALGTVHRRFYQSHDIGHFDVSEFARDLATDLVGGSGRDDIRLDLDLDPVEIHAGNASSVALMINELLTNALKHAFVNERPGKISVTIKHDETHFGIKIVDDGVGMPGHSLGKGSFGKRLVETLARQVNATIAWQPANPGTQIDIRLPRKLTDV